MATQNSLSTAELKKIWTYEKLDNGTLRIKKYKGSDTYIEVPEKIGKSIVSTIGYKAFSPYEGTFWSIHSLSMDEADKIKKWRITPEEAEIRRNITTVVLPDCITSIEDGAFCNCEKLEDCAIPEGVQSVGEAAFKGTAIKKVAIPNTVKCLPRETFKDCSNLQTVDLGYGLEEIGTFAFDRCENLSSVIFRQDTMEIDSQAFADTKWLTDLDEDAIIAGVYRVALNVSSRRYLKRIEE